jgi:hypothetical protein
MAAPAAHAQSIDCNVNGHLADPSCPNYGVCLGCANNYNAETALCAIYEFWCYYAAYGDYERCVTALLCYGYGCCIGIGVNLPRDRIYVDRPRLLPEWLLA